jgi:tRNA threonylcarbamoyladenosine biosynthesis protein TsaE
MKTLRWSSREQTRKWVHAFFPELKRPCVVLLSGPLGAGKTQLVKWFLEELGFAETVSPTFAIHQTYSSRGETIDHVDLYRLKSDADLESSGFWDLFSQPTGLVFVEWADRLPESVWPRNWKRISIALKAESEQARRADIEITASPLAQA